MVLFVACAFRSLAQDDREKQMQEYIRQQNRVLDQLKQEEKEYFDARDKQFAAFLADKWMPARTKAAVVADVKPKPIQLPTKPSTTDQNVDFKTLPPPPPVKVDIPQVDSVYTPTATNNITKPENDKQQGLTVDFFGCAIKLRIPNGIAAATKPAVWTNKQIAAWWTSTATMDWSTCLSQLKDTESYLYLNGWGFYQLVKKTSEMVYATSPDHQILLQWFLLMKSGYAARIGVTQAGVMPLVSFDGFIYEKPYFDNPSDKKRYFLLNQPQGYKGSFVTYKADYQTDGKPLKLRLDRLPKLPIDTLSKSITFAFDNKPYQFTYALNKNLLPFLEAYPSTEIGLRFNADIDELTFEPLKNQLKNAIKGFSQEKSLDFLLRMIQLGIPYKTDEEQFNREYYMFAEECLYYPAADCEDRSVLFSVIVTSVLGLNVIGLDYPGHIATAVQMNTRPDGAKSFQYQGKTYVICDPTYINANTGMCMPDYVQVSPQIIAVNGNLR